MTRSQTRRKEETPWTSPRLPRLSLRPPQARPAASQLLSQVMVTTALGSKLPSLKVKVVRAFIPGSKDTFVIENQEFLDLVPMGNSFKCTLLCLRLCLKNQWIRKLMPLEGRHNYLSVSRVIQMANSEISILDSDLGSVDAQKKLNLEGENNLKLAANHLQKLRLSFQLSTPLGRVFQPHQVFLKLKHEKAEHIFVLGNSGQKFQIVLDFLGLIEKFFYLSDRYDIQLTVGDAVMENSVFQSLGHVELDLPEALEKALRPPSQPMDPFLKYGPKEEITDIFRSPEKRPSGQLSLTFLGIYSLPFVGFFGGKLDQTYQTVGALPLLLLTGFLLVS